MYSTECVVETDLLRSAGTIIAGTRGGISIFKRSTEDRKKVTIDHSN